MTHFEQPPGDEQLRARIGQVSGQLARDVAKLAGVGGRVPQVAQQPLVRREIDRLAIIGIDQAKGPAFLPLIDVGKAGRGEFQRQFGQRIDQAERGQRALPFA